MVVGSVGNNNSNANGNNNLNNNNGRLVGIEVETGANKMKQLAGKILWLNKHFDQWIFVCPRKEKNKYNQLVDHKKSFCMMPKQAKEHIIKLFAPLEHR